jgi:alanine racemase
MHRMGLSYKEVRRGYYELSFLSTTVSVKGIMTHFSSADEIYSEEAVNQIKQFKNTLRYIPVECSIANSAATFALPESHCDWVRPGLSLWGVSPFIETDSEQLELKPVKTLKSIILSIRRVKKN